MVISLLLFLFGSTPAFADSGEGNAAGIIETIKSQVLSAGKAVRDSKLGLESRENQPLLATLRELATVVEATEDAVLAGGGDFADQLRRLNELAPFVPVVIERSTFQQDLFGPDARSLGIAIEALYSNYGPEARLAKRSEALDDREKIELSRIYERYKALSTKLADLATLTRDRDNRKLSAMVATLAAVIPKHNADEATPAALARVLQKIDNLKGTWLALGIYVDRKDQSDWNLLGDEVKALSAIYSESTKGLSKPDRESLTRNVALTGTMTSPAKVDPGEAASLMSYLENLKVQLRDMQQSEFADIDRVIYAPIPDGPRKSQAEESSERKETPSAINPEEEVEEEVEANPSRISDEDGDLAKSEEDEIQEIGEERLDHDVERWED
jgi:hypothetical protein